MLTYRLTHPAPSPSRHGALLWPSAWQRSCAGSVRCRTARHRRWRPGGITMRRHAVGFGVLVLVACAVGRPAVLAQEGTPLLPVSPDPAECQVEPRSIDDFGALLGTPPPGPDAAATPVPLPAGEA